MNFRCRAGKTRRSAAGACQGHNVAPDGGKNNPYTVDHKNHPGLFNASGHIGLLGHGAGIKFRNIRIKELPAAKTKK